MSLDKSIFYIADSKFPSKAANSVHVIHQINALANYFKFATLSVICTKKISSKEVKEAYGTTGNSTLILNYFSKLKGAIYFKGFKDVIRVIKNSYDVVYGRSLIGMYLMSFFHHCLIFEVHTTIWDKNGRNRTFFKRILHTSRTLKVVVISGVLKQIVLDEFGKNFADKITVMHDAAPENTYNVHNNFGSRNIGYIGSFYNGRGIELILELATRFQDKQFHLIGGTKEDITQTEIPKNIKFYGYLSYSEASKLRAEMDVLLAPYQIGLSTQGGRDTSNYMSPLKVFEYMAARKPIVISDLPVIREVLSEENSILVEPNNLEKWEEALEQLSDPILAERLAVNAYNLFQKEYTWDIRARKIFQLTEQK